MPQLEDRYGGLDVGQSGGGWHPPSPWPGYLQAAEDDFTDLEPPGTSGRLEEYGAGQDGGNPLQRLGAIAPLSEGSTEVSTIPAPPAEPSKPEESVPGEEEYELGFLPVLRNFNFLKLWSGQIFSQIADKVYLVLIISIVASQFQAEGQSISGWVSALMIAFTIPAVVLGSIAGVFVDRWSKKAVLTVTNFLRGGLVMALQAVLWLAHGHTFIGGLPTGFYGLLLITFLVSTLTQFFAPAEQAVIPLIVEHKHLLSANSLYTTTMMASVIIGFAVGEPALEFVNHLISLLPFWEAMHVAPDVGKDIAVGGCYAIAGALLLITKTKELPVDPEKEHPHVFEDIKDGLRYLGKQGRVRAALIQLVMLFSIFAALAVLAVRMAEIMPAIESDQFGFLLAAGGVGMAIGAAGIGQFGQRFSRRQLSLVGSVGMAIALAVLPLFIQQLWITLSLIGILGTFAALVAIPMQTTIQAETPEEMRGKVFGLQNNAVNIALSLPLALAGIAETYLGLQAVFLILSGLAIAAGATTWYISRRGSTDASCP
ncbi:MAG: MFS transporter [Synechococcales cyanobacterium T60_A2020_003]|nr:MFS transporter [Synechococcales cyanobacterium T60_A2020_003]